MPIFDKKRRHYFSLKQGRYNNSLGDSGSGIDDNQTIDDMQNEDENNCMIKNISSLL